MISRTRIYESMFLESMKNASVSLAASYNMMKPLIDTSPISAYIVYKEKLSLETMSDTHIFTYPNRHGHVIFNFIRLYFI